MAILFLLAWMAAGSPREIAAAAAESPATSSADSTALAAPGANLVTNKMCPVLTDEEVDPDIFSEYRGKRVYFCCTKCKRKFEETPEVYLANLPQFASRESVSGVAVPAKPSVREGSPQDAGPESNRAGLSVSARAVRFVGKFHPVMVHFPIALLLAAALAELIALVSSRSFWRESARFCLALGAPAAVIAAALGWADAAFTRHPGMETVVEVHRWLGTSTAVLGLVALVLSFLEAARRRSGARKTYLFCVFATALLVGVTGHFGAALVYGLDYFSR